MRKILLAIVALLSVSLAGCTKDVELVRQVVLDGKTFPVSEMEVIFYSSDGDYFFESPLVDIPNVYCGGFDQSLIGKSLNPANSNSDKKYWFSLNGYHELDNGELVMGGDIFYRNENGQFNTSFKSGSMKVYEINDCLVVEIKGTLEKGVDFVYQNYTEKSKITTY